MLERIQGLVKELRDVTNNIAHDLRSPLTRIRGIAETTLTGEPTLDAYREMAGMVIEESDRLVEMINIMLEIAMAESGVRDLPRDEVDMTELAKEACELFHVLAEDKQVWLGIEIPQEHLIIQGDRSRLQRIIANLLDNAIKFTPRGGNVLLFVEGTLTHVIVSVADTGMGINSQDLPHIFERFYRADRSRSTPGNGLGLSLVQALVRCHSGEITVESNPGKGSKFTLSLPRPAS
jgi:signal transduction histidine kinase